MLLASILVIGGLGGAALARGPAKKFDENGDGRLDDAERAKMQAVRAAQRAKRKAEAVAKYDANKNGVLDPAERKAMRAERAAARFKKLDADGDGKLTQEEFSKRGGRGRRP